MGYDIGGFISKCETITPVGLPWPRTIEEIRSMVQRKQHKILPAISTTVVNNPDLRHPSDTRRSSLQVDLRLVSFPENYQSLYDLRSKVSFVEIHKWLTDKLEIQTWAYSISGTSKYFPRGIYFLHKQDMSAFLLTFGIARKTVDK